MALDTDKLPAYARNILNKYLIPKNYNVPVESLLLTLNIFCSNFICYNRVRIECEDVDVDTFPNVYVIGFMPSGDGKDKPISDMNKLLDDLFREREEKEKEYHEKIKSKIEEEANNLFGGSNVAKQKYIEEKAPRLFLTEYGDATVEGFISMRGTMQEAGFGNICFSCSEFLDYIESPNMRKNELLSAVKEAFDSGDTKAKLIKGDKKIVPVYGVPSTMFVHSAFGSLFKEEGKSTKDKLHNFLAMGLARRSFIFISSKGENIAKQMLDAGAKESLKSIKELIKNAKKYKKEIINIFNNVIGACNYDIAPNLQMTENAKLAYFHYRLQKDNQSHGISEIENEGWRAEVKNRFWKMIKLAGVIAIFEHPKRWEITKKDVEMAIYQAEYFSQFLKLFYEKGNGLDVEKAFNYIIENGGITKTQLRKFCQQMKMAKRYDQTRWVNDIIKQLKQYCEDNGYVYCYKKGLKNAEKRIVIEKQKTDPIDIEELDKL